MDLFPLSIWVIFLTICTTIQIWKARTGEILPTKRWKRKVNKFEKSRKKEEEEWRILEVVEVVKVVAA